MTEGLKACGNCGAPARWVELAWRVKCTRPACGVEGGKHFETRREATAAWNTRSVHSPMPGKGDGLNERAVMVCPQCEGEGGYADGFDEAACHTECTRCGGNGWIVDLSALSPRSDELVEALSEALYTLSDRLRADKFLERGDHHAVYERVVAAFQYLASTPQ